MTPSVSTHKDQAREDERAEKAAKAYDVARIAGLIKRGATRPGCTTAKMEADAHREGIAAILSLASARPSPGDPVRAAEGVVWTPSSVKPDVGRKIICLYDDGSGAALFYTHDHGVIDSDGDEYAALSSDYSLWAYLPDDFELHCELHSEPGEHPMHLPVVRAALSVSAPTGEGEEPCPQPHRYDRGECCGGDCAAYPPQKGERIAQALSDADWPDTSIGNKALIKAAIQAIRHAYRADLAHPQQEGERDRWPEFPSGAIENGRAHLTFLSSLYQFEDEQGHPISLCADYDGAIRCFEAMAEFIEATAPTSPSKSSGEEA